MRGPFLALALGLAADASAQDLAALHAALADGEGLQVEIYDVQGL